MELVIPPEFWFNNNLGLALPLYIPDPKSNHPYYHLICRCSSDEVYDVLDNKEKYPKIAHLLNMFSDEKLKPLEELQDKTLIEECVDFLLVRDEIEIKVINLNEYITEHLNLVDGEEYILMNMLQNYNIISRGSGIRCAWFDKDPKNPYYTRKVSDEVREKMTKILVPS
jgi:hypothetical protein